MYMYVFMLFFYCLFIYINGYIYTQMDIKIFTYGIIYIYVRIFVHSIISMLLKYCIISSS